MCFFSDMFCAAAELWKWTMSVMLFHFILFFRSHVTNKYLPQYMVCCNIQESKVDIVIFITPKIKWLLGYQDELPNTADN